MRNKLLLIIALAMTTFGLMAQKGTGISGVIVDAESGNPIAGAAVIVEGQGVIGYTGAAGDFLIPDAVAGDDVAITVLANGYKDYQQTVNIMQGVVDNVGEIRISSDIEDAAAVDQQELLTEDQLQEEETSSQSISSLISAPDNVYYRASNFNFSIMRFRYRGYDPDRSSTYINGVEFNEPIRGRFSYSMLGGMTSTAFRNRTTTLINGISFDGYGDIGGTTGINIQAKDYAKGGRASVAYTNSNYYLRAMVTYATGLQQNGWAFTASAIARYANEGIFPGTFYNSAGLFLSLQKVFNNQHSLSLSAFGTPTTRAGNAPTYQQIYDLVGDNKYNRAWGYMPNGKKRSARVVESFDPTVILNWVWTPSVSTKLNTGLAFRASKYASSTIEYASSKSPYADYYRNLPSYLETESTQEMADAMANIWRTDENFRQLNWSQMYYMNYLNMRDEQNGGVAKGAEYILANRNSNQRNFILNSTLNHRFSKMLSLQGGIGLNYTKGIFYESVKDLLGSNYWIDINSFAEQYDRTNKDIVQNDLNNPDRHVVKGDRFGYDYDINVFTGNAFLQNQLHFAHWDVNYAAQYRYTTYQRDGKMRNGRAPENSYGKGTRHNYHNGGIKASVVYKLDGRNNFIFDASFDTHAPLPDMAYISARTKDDFIFELDGKGNRIDPKSERVMSFDAAYMFNYRNFRGVVGAFYTDMTHGTERTIYYDDVTHSNINFVLTNVHRVYKGIEFGLAYKIIPSLTLTAAGTYARYQYKNRPTATKNYDNGVDPDVTETAYIKNFYVAGTPQQAYSLGLDWAAPHAWYFNLNGTWMGDSYVSLAPSRHVASNIKGIAAVSADEADFNQKLAAFNLQEKLKNAFVLNFSVGKFIRLQRGLSMNVNLNINNLLNNKNIQTSGFQSARIDTRNYTTTRYPNKYYYAQGIRIFLNVGLRF